MSCLRGFQPLDSIKRKFIDYEQLRAVVDSKLLRQRLVRQRSGQIVEDLGGCLIKQQIVGISKILNVGAVKPKAVSEIISVFRLASLDRNDYKNLEPGYFRFMPPVWIEEGNTFNPSTTAADISRWSKQANMKSSGNRSFISRAEAR
jgi:hypothetical protein